MTAARTDARIDQEIERLQLPASYRQLVDQYLLPLSDQIFGILGKRAASKQAFVVGVNGAQGTGKSTLCQFLKLLFETRFKQRCVIVSIDDFYLGYAERMRLGVDRHPLLQTRGVPGTHDVKQAIVTIKALLAGQPVTLPQFDKASDDVVPRQHWSAQQQAVDIILFEGWCVGARPEAEEALAIPINRLESEEDGDGVWRHYVNTCLGAEYQVLFGFIDYLVMLQAPDMESVLEWRHLQEKKLAEKVGNSGPGLMDESQIRRFVDHYERLTRHMLEEVPTRANTVFKLAADHNIRSVSW